MLNECKMKNLFDWHVLRELLGFWFFTSWCTSCLWRSMPLEPQMAHQCLCIRLAVVLAWNSSCGNLSFHQHFSFRDSFSVNSLLWPGFWSPPGQVGLSAVHQPTVHTCRPACLLTCMCMVMCKRPRLDGSWFGALALVGPSCEIYRNPLTHEEMKDQ